MELKAFRKVFHPYATKEQLLKSDNTVVRNLLPLYIYKSFV